MSGIINKIIHADVLEGLKQIPDDFVDCIITSPPYYSLRDYSEDTVEVWDGNPNCEHDWGDKIVKQGVAGIGNTGNKIIPGQDTHQSQGQFCQKCGAWKGQLGLEPTLDLYLNHLLQITAELKRVLKPTGVVFWVHGDSYNGSGKAGSNPEYWERHTEFGKPSRKERFGRPTNLNSIPTKCMLMQPERLAMRMVDEQGWILRNKIVWYKGGSEMPESVKDRFSRSWEYVFMFIKSKKYWFDLDAVRDPLKSPLHSPSNTKTTTKSELDPFNKAGNLHGQMRQPNRTWGTNKGKNPGDTWTMTTEPYPEAHFATFPSKLVKRCIKAGCPEQVCRRCGKARVRITEKQVDYTSGSGRSGKQPVGKYHGKTQTISGEYDIRMGPQVSYKTTGWTDCGCNAGWDKGIVLDPFMGSGTTALVALKLNRNFIGIEINKDYVDMAYRRIKPYLEQEKLEKWL